MASLPTAARRAILLNEQAGRGVYKQGAGEA
jgi:hypothetical protein